jgi:hypothetical protein
MLDAPHRRTCCCALKGEKVPRGRVTSSCSMLKSDVLSMRYTIERGLQESILRHHASRRPQVA